MEKILYELNSTGISKSTVWDFLDESGIKHYEDTLSFFKESKNPELINKIKSINRGERIKKGKWYELGIHEIQDAPLSLEQGGPIPLYLSPQFLELAEKYHENSDCRLRNVLTWIHPHSPNRNPSGSQLWHRDTEHYRILKVFIYYSNVGPNTGALEYCKWSTGDGKNSKIFTMPSLRHSGYLADKESKIPQEDIVQATGKPGDIWFVDTHGYHRGGMIKQGERWLTQGCFIPHNAEQIKNGPLYTFDYTLPKRSLQFNRMNIESSQYQQLSKRQKNYLK